MYAARHTIDPGFKLADPDVLQFGAFSLRFGRCSNNRHLNMSVSIHANDSPVPSQARCRARPHGRIAMPFVTISLQRGKSAEYIDGLSSAVHEALVQELG